MCRSVSQSILPPMGTWRSLEHTADLALEGEGASREEALEALLLGLMNQISDPEKVRPTERVPLEAQGFDLPETLVSALNELLYLVNGKGWVFHGFEAREASANYIRAVGIGEPRDARRHAFDLEIKAATYHDLSFALEGGHWKIRVLFDI